MKIAVLSALVLFSAVTTSLHAKPYSYVEQQQFGASYQSIQTAGDFLLAVAADSNYIDLYDKTATGQTKPQQRFSFSSRVNAAVWSAGYLVVAQNQSLGFYQLDNSGQLLLRFSWADKAASSLAQSGSYLAVQGPAGVEVFLWKNGQPELHQLFAKPTGYYQAQMRIEQNQLLLAWQYSYSGAEVKIQKIDLNSLQSSDTELSAVADLSLLSPEQFIYRDRQNKYLWMGWNGQQWQPKNQADYLMDLQTPGLLFLKDDKIYNYGAGLGRAKVLQLLKLDNNTIAIESMPVAEESHCTAVATEGQNWFCLGATGARQLNWNALFPTARPDIFSHRQAFTGMTATDQKLFVRGSTAVYGLSASEPDFSAELFKDNSSIADMLAVKNKVLVRNNAGQIIQFAEQQGQWQAEAQSTVSQGWSPSVRYWQSSEDLLIVNGSFTEQAFSLYPAGAADILNTSPVQIPWASLILPGNAKVLDISMYQLEGDWLLFEALTESGPQNISYAVYAVQLDSVTHQIKGSVQAVTSALIQPGRQKHSMTSYKGRFYLQQVGAGRGIEVFSPDNGIIKRLGGFGAEDELANCGQADLSVTDDLLISSPGSATGGTDLCLFDLSANPVAPVSLGALALPWFNSTPDYRSAVQVAKLGEYLIAGQIADGRTLLLKQNYAPQLRQLVSAIDKNSAATLVANSVDPESDPVVLSLSTLPLHGKVTLNGTEIWYQPDANYAGQDQFTVTSADSQQNFSQQQFQIEIRATNGQPQFSDSSYNAQEGVTFTTRLNAMDPDGDLLSYAITVQPTKGSATISATGQLSYLATSAGSDSMKVRVSDPSGLTAEATLTFSIGAKATPGTDNSAGSGGGGGAIHWVWGVLLSLSWLGRRRWGKD